MIDVKVVTIDGQEERFRLDRKTEGILIALETDSPTFILEDKTDTLWFVKSHIIKVKIHELQT